MSENNAPLFRSVRLFSAFAIVVVAFKLVLTSGIAIVPLTAPFDETNYLTHAMTVASGAWFGPYDQLTLVKMPMFPIVLAALSKCAIPLPLAHQFIVALVALVACAAVRPIVKDDRVLCALFAFVLFEPTSYDESAWLVQRSQIAGSAALSTYACACGFLLRPTASFRSSALWATGLGLSVSIFWFTREESVWILVPLALLGAPLARQALLAPRRAALSRFLCLAIAPAIWIATYGTLASIDRSAYGVPAILETQSYPFLAAYESLLRIRHAAVNRRIPVPRESLLQAYRVSAAARELRPGFDGVYGERGRRISCTWVRVCDDIAGGWFVWILRAIVASDGHAGSEMQANVFYQRLANELDRACDERRLACDRKGSSMIPRIALADVPTLAANYVAGIETFYDPRMYRLLPAFPNAIPDLASYRTVTGPIASVPPVFDVRDGILTALADLEHLTFIIASSVAALAIVVRSVRYLRVRESVALANVIGAGTFGGVIALVAVLTVVQTFFFTGYVSEYFSSSYPLAYFGAGLVCASLKR